MTTQAPAGSGGRIALVDDEESLRETVGFALRREGYRVEEYPDGLAAWQSFERDVRDLPDLVILDILMPRMDGRELCRRLRALSERLPILFLTSRDEEFDRVLGLELGADDYLCKPFSMRELAARVKVLLRRAAHRQAPPDEERLLEAGRLRLAPARYQAFWNGAPVPLKVTEFTLLHALARRPGHVKTRAQLLEEGYPHDAYASDRTIDSHVKRLRKKLAEADPASDAIETVYGLGYPPRPEGAVRLRLPSRISARLLLFNVLLVFLPVAGFLYLGVYERQLLEDQERAMVQQGRLLAAAMADRPVLDAAAASSLLRPLGSRTEARLRIFGADGALLADSAGLGPRKPEEPAASRSDQPRDTRDSLLYRGAAGAYRIWRLLRGGRSSSGVDLRRYPSQDLPSSAKAVRAALAGRYGAAVGTTGGELWRPSPTLQSAIPVRNGNAVVGAVLVSQTTVRILREIDQVRLDVLKVFLGSVGGAAILALLLAGTITHPIRRLRDEASDLLDRRGRLRGRFGGSRRADEIGDLARALEELSHRLAAHQHALESFASDVSHELKNPLASVRSAAELLADVEDPADRALFLTLVQREVTRMERLLTAVLEIGEIDARLETESPEAVDLEALLREVVEGFRRRADNREIRLVSPGPVRVRARSEHLLQDFENLLANPLGFSPAGGTVTVTLAANGIASVRIEDQGPGIPESHLGRIFDRFFTYRPDEPHARDGHTGLGLAIVKAIVEGYGGTVAAGNREGGGARFEVRLPG